VNGLVPVDDPESAIAAWFVEVEGRQVAELVE
jgi:hypothetical protein